MKLKLFLLLITIHFSIFSQDYTIRGFIFDKSSGEPVAYEKVKLLKSSDSSIVAGAISDLDGFFNIPKINKGNFLIKIERNIETAKVKLSFQAGFVLPIDRFAIRLSSSSRNNPRSYTIKSLEVIGIPFQVRRCECKARQSCRYVALASCYSQRSQPKRRYHSNDRQSR